MGLVAQHRVSYLDTVPVLGFEYFHSPLARQCTSLRVAVFGGDALPPELVAVVHGAMVSPVAWLLAWSPRWPPLH